MITTEELDDAICGALAADRNGKHDGVTATRHLERLLKRLRDDPVIGEVEPIEQRQAHAYRVAVRRLRLLHTELSSRRQDWANNDVQPCSSARAVAYQSAMSSVGSIVDECEAIAAGGCAVTAPPVPSGSESEAVGSLTETERKAVEMAGDLWGLLCQVVGIGPTRDADLRELIVHIHAIQQAVMSQAAGRCYPDEFRLLGSTLPAQPARSQQQED